MSLSSLGLGLVVATILILPPIIFATAALKIRLAWLDRPFSRQLAPIHFWIDVLSVVTFFGAVLILLLIADKPRPDVSLKMSATLLAMTSGNLALGWRHSSRQPLKLEFASVRESRGGSLIGGVILWCVAAAVGAWAYSELLSGTR